MDYHRSIGKSKSLAKDSLAIFLDSRADQQLIVKPMAADYHFSHIMAMLRSTEIAQS